MTKTQQLFQEDIFDAVIIGNIAKEINIDEFGDTGSREGGAIVYAASSCSSNNAKIAVTTKLAKEDFSLIEPLHAKHADIYYKFNGNTAIIQNKLSNKIHVETTCINQGSPFQICDIPDVKSYYYLFVNDFYGEISLDLINYYSHYGKIALDASCFVRRINPSTKLITNADYHHKKYLASLCDIFKLTMDQAKILTGESDTQHACEIIKSWGANEVLITENKILHLLDENNVFHSIHIPEFCGNEYLYTDATAFAIYVTQRITSNPETSLLCAAAVTMCKLQRPGPAKCKRAEINLNLDTYFYHK